MIITGPIAGETHRRKTVSAMRSLLLLVLCALCAPAYSLERVKVEVHAGAPGGLLLARQVLRVMSRPTASDIEGEFGSLVLQRLPQVSRAGRRLQWGGYSTDGTLRLHLIDDGAADGIGSMESRAYMTHNHKSHKRHKRHKRPRRCRRLWNWENQRARAVGVKHNRWWQGLLERP